MFFLETNLQAFLLFLEKYFCIEVPLKKLKYLFRSSLTYIRNNKGPIIELCRTSHVILLKAVHLLLL